MASAASSSPPLPRTRLGQRGAREGPVGRDRASACQTSLHEACDVAAPGTAGATEAPCWPGTLPHCSGLSGPLCRVGTQPSPREACGVGARRRARGCDSPPPPGRTLCLSAPPRTWAAMVTSLHRCKIQPTAARGPSPRPRRGHQPGLHGWGHPRHAWHHSALGKGHSMVTATSQYRPPRPLGTQHCAWASLAPAGPARSGGGVVSGLASSLQEQSRAQARVSGSLSA